MQISQRGYFSLPKTLGSPTVVVGDALGWLIVLGIIALAFSTTLLVIARVHRRRQAHGANDSAAMLVALSVGFLSFIGGWLVIDVYWLTRTAWRVTDAIRRRSSSRTGQLRDWFLGRTEPGRGRPLPGRPGEHRR